MEIYISRTNAFSLVELSIVLVILGLLTGGILTGQNLIRAAELRSVATEANNYQTASLTFRDRFFYLPGDMPNATDFWGGAGGNGKDATCRAATGTGTQTCGGDGDGVIESTTTTIPHEAFRFWQHLANAGLIEGSYTGVQGPLSLRDGVAGVNCPSSKLSPGVWGITYMSGTVGSSDTVFFAGNYNNTLTMGGDSSTASGESDYPMLKPEELWNIDVKMDDGLPASGNLIARKNQSDCITTNDPTTAKYELNNSSIACIMLFRNFF